MVCFSNYRDFDYCALDGAGFLPRLDLSPLSRCYPLELNEMRLWEGKTCFYSGRPATHMALFARAFWGIYFILLRVTTANVKLELPSTARAWKLRKMFGDEESFKEGMETYIGPPRKMASRPFVREFSVAWYGVFAVTCENSRMIHLNRKTWGRREGVNRDQASSSENLTWLC